MATSLTSLVSLFSTSSLICGTFSLGIQALTVQRYQSNLHHRKMWTKSRRVSGIIEATSIAEINGNIKETESVSIALTREDGKNAKILTALQTHPRLSSSVCPCTVTEIPCIAHAQGPDAGDAFLSTLTSSSSLFDYITITSPEAAKVFASTWKLTNLPNDDLPQICAVGKATEKALNSSGFSVSFVPSKATAATLVKELPGIENKDRTRPRTFTNVLYPASAKAKPTLQNGLQAREDTKFHVTRLDTYDTVPASWTEEQFLVAKEQIEVVCFASPSAVESWVEKVNQGSDGLNVATTRTLAACIGETSAQACREMGWKEEDIYYPDKPGVEGWAECVADAAERILKEKLL